MRRASSNYLKPSDIHMESNLDANLSSAGSIIILPLTRNLGVCSKKQLSLYTTIGVCSHSRSIAMFLICFYFRKYPSDSPANNLIFLTTTPVIMIIITIINKSTTVPFGAVQIVTAVGLIAAAICPSVICTISYS